MPFQKIRDRFRDMDLMGFATFLKGGEFDGTSHFFNEFTEGADDTYCICALKWSGWQEVEGVGEVFIDGVTFPEVLRFGNVSLP
jgi:hypothetical protein